MGKAMDKEMDWEKRNHRFFWRGGCFFARAGDQIAFGNGLYSQNLLKINLFRNKPLFLFN
jgi:hypothetical protein